MAIRPLARHVPHISACWRLPPPCMRTPDRTQRVPAFHRAQVPLQRRKVSGRGRPACGRSGARTEGRVRRCRHGHAAADHPARPLEQMQGRATHAAATLPSRRRRFRGRREESAFKTIRFPISKRRLNLVPARASTAAGRCVPAPACILAERAGDPRDTARASKLLAVRRAATVSGAFLPVGPRQLHILSGSIPLNPHPRAHAVLPPCSMPRRLRAHEDENFLGCV